VNESTDESVFNLVKKHKKKGVVVLLLCVLACKLPLLIALVGLGSLGSASFIMPLSTTAQTLVLAGSIIGVLAIVSYLAHQVYVKVNA